MEVRAFLDSMKVKIVADGDNQDADTLLRIFTQGLSQYELSELELRRIHPALARQASQQLLNWSWMYFLAPSVRVIVIQNVEGLVVNLNFIESELVGPQFPTGVLELRPCSSLGCQCSDCQSSQEVLH